MSKTQEMINIIINNGYIPIIQHERNLVTAEIYKDGNGDYIEYITTAISEELALTKCMNYIYTGEIPDKDHEEASSKFERIKDAILSDDQLFPGTSEEWSKKGSEAAADLGKMFDKAEDTLTVFGIKTVKKGNSLLSKIKEKLND